MANWEYCTVEYSAAHDEILKLRLDGQELKDWQGKSWKKYLNSLGKEGWEMVGVTGSNVFWNLYFKRIVD